MLAQDRRNGQGKEKVAQRPRDVADRSSRTLLAGSRILGGAKPFVLEVLTRIPRSALRPRSEAEWDCGRRPFVPDVLTGIPRPLWGAAGC
jgi:hypothetical protein